MSIANMPAIHSSHKSLCKNEEKLGAPNKKKIRPLWTKQ